MEQPRSRGWIALCLGFVMACSHTPMRAGYSQRLPDVQSARAAFDTLRGGGGVSGITPLHDNDVAWAARWQAMSAATQSIDTSYFILENDVFGFAFLGLLYKKAREGVKVRVLIDGRGSGGIATPLFGRDYLQELVATGNAEVRVFNPPMSQVFTSLSQASVIPMMSGTHNKILVMDRKTGITGGRNIARQYFASPEEDDDSHIDADVILDGPAIAELEDAFEEEWLLGDREEIKADPVNLRPRAEQLLMMHAAMDAWLTGRVQRGAPEEMARALEGAAVSALDKLPAPPLRDQVRRHLEDLTELGSLYGTVPMRSLPRFETELRVVSAAGRAQAIDSSVTDALLRSIQGAKSDVVLVSPYVLLTPAQLEAMIGASLRGVRITLITNSPISTDNLASQSLFVDTWPELCARIKTLRVYAGDDDRMMHAKIAVIDDELTLVGTYNLDPFSAYVNSEMFVAVWSHDYNTYTRIEAARIMKPMVEYKIARDERGNAIRHPIGEDDAGDPVVLFGPKNHTPRYKMVELRAVKPVVIATKGLWDFEVVAW